MKILHIGLCVDGKNEGLPFALKQASTFYHEISTGERDLQGKILSAINQYEFDIAFFQIQTAGIVHPFVFHNIQDKGIFTVNWNGDCRIGTPSWHFNTNANLTLFSNERDVQNMRNAGLKSDFLQIGIDPKVFNIHNNASVKGNDIVYMGNNHSQFPESRSRTETVQFIKSKYGGAFSFYGNGWDGASGENNADQKRQSIIYNNSKIAINYSQFNEERYTSDRMFRILASGCFCLSQHYKGIEKDFEIGKHLDTFKDVRELQSKIDFYLNNPEERKRIAKHGYAYCHKTFAYSNMVENLINLVEKYKS